MLLSVDIRTKKTYRCALPLLEEIAFQFYILGLCKFCGSHADVLDMANEIALRERCIVHRAGIPESLRTCRQ